jgi:hypothetical protein
MSVRGLMTGREDIVLTWGVWVTLAYLITQALGGMSLPIPGEIVVMTVWSLFMIPPVLGSYRDVQAAETRITLNGGWALAIGLGVIGNWIGMVTITDAMMLVQSYYHRWFLIGLIGFAYTAWRVEGTSRQIYGGAAFLNALMLPAMGQYPTVMLWAFGIAAVIQGLPMLADWYQYSSA